MEIKIGEHIFPDKERYLHLLATGLVKDYDLMPKMREQHDLDAVFNSDGVKIKATPEELKEYWRKRLAVPGRIGGPIQPGEDVINPWIKRERV